MLHVLRSANYAKKTETTKYYGIYLGFFERKFLRYKPMVFLSLLSYKLPTCLILMV